ncbi:uncharacterized protein LOC142612079 [Castanea sativa]|uniref:uncharacterized protein LOC142612079 n=1 Tax=Castanea sativa TaxID=21020 RepID=UPI003F64F3FB
MLWLVCGDFNEIVHPDEKLGWRDRDADQMKAFREVLSKCGLIDLGFVGQRFTWCKGRFGDQRTLIRLDRMVANEAWSLVSPEAKVHHVSMSSSDHCLLALFLNKDHQQRRGKKRFFFEAMWTREEECKEIIELAWDPYRDDSVLSIQERIERSSQRRRKNRIGGLMDEMGAWHEDQETTERIILEYFKSIYSSDQPARFDESLNAMELRVTPNMNEELQKEFKAEENTKEEIREFSKGTFGAQIIQHHEKYLGLPPPIGRAKKKAFNRIKDQIGRKIAGWKGKLLSNAGREVLIKAVAQATPTYTMNAFKLSDSLCSELNSMMGGFWWGQQGREKKVAWVSWKNLCKPKAEGGMGFRDLKDFNLALLTKQGWRLQQNPYSLAHRVLKAIYFPNSSFMEAQPGSKPSNIWRSIMAAKNIIKEGSRWVFGDGRSIEIWNASWLPSSASGKVITPKDAMGFGENVASLINHEKEEWRTMLVKHIFLPHEAETILSIPLSPLNPTDSLNTIRHGGVCKQSKIIAEEARGYREEVRSALPSKGQSPQLMIKHTHWTPLPQGWYKVNVDAAVFEEQGTCGIDVVIRNNHGQIMGAMSKKLEFPLRALEAEAKATEAGILLAWDLGLKNIIVERDAQLVIHALKGVTAPAIPILKIIEASRRYL